MVLGGDKRRARAAVRAGLEHLGFSVVAEVNDADEAVEAAREHHPSVCLLDVDMPGGGIDAAKRINSELPDTKIAILYGSAQRDNLREAIRAGADGYLLRSTAPDRLGAAINGLINGEAALPRALTGSLVRELREIERRLEQSSNGDAPPASPAGAARRRRDAAARGAAAAGRAAAARRAAEARRARAARRTEEARRAAGVGRTAGAGRAAEATRARRADETQRDGEKQRAGKTRRSAGRFSLSTAISSRVLYLPRLVRHFRRRLRSGQPVAIAWASARARMADYARPPIEPSATVAEPGPSSHAP